MLAESFNITSPIKRRHVAEYSGMLPVRPDMLAFIQWRENIAPGQAIRLPGHGAISTQLANIIEFGKYMYFPGANRMAPENEDLTAKLKFVADPGLIDCSFFEYADLVAHYFNQYLYKYWLDCMATFVQSAVFYAPGLDSKDILSDFQRQTGVDMYREFDADIKAYYRLRLSRNQVTPRRKSG